MASSSSEPSTTATRCTKGRSANRGSVHHPPCKRRRHHHRAAPRHGERVRRAPARRRRGHARVHEGRREAVRRSRSRPSSTGSPSSPRSTSPQRRTVRRRTSARWWWRWRATSACLLVKLCDRVDNMRTLEHMSPEAQERIARETMDIYAPLANRLGIGRVQERARGSLRSSTSSRPRTPSSWRRSRRTSATATSTPPRSARPCRAGWPSRASPAEVSGRAKHLYSIWRKMKAQQCTIDQVHDMHRLPRPGRERERLLRDARRHPLQVDAGAGALQGLHRAARSRTCTSRCTRRSSGRPRSASRSRSAPTTCTASPSRASPRTGSTRTRKGGGIADAGRARSSAGSASSSSGRRTSRTRPSSSRASRSTSSRTRSTSSRPRGTCASSRAARRRSTSRSRSTRELGEHITGARVNGKLEPLRYKLRNGDIVEVVTSANQQPSKDWLDFVGTSRARSKIRNFFREEQRDKSLRLGKELLEREFHKAGVSLGKLLKNDKELRKVLEALKLTSQEELLINIGYGKLHAEDVVAVVAPPDDHDPGDQDAGGPEGVSRRRAGAQDHQARRQLHQAERHRRRARALRQVLQPAARGRHPRLHHARDAASPSTVEAAARRSTPTPSAASRSAGTRRRRSTAWCTSGS